MSYFLVNRLDLQIIGTGIASGLTNGFVFIIAYLYSLRFNEFTSGDCEYKVFDMDSMKEYFKIGIPQTLMCCSEWWAYEFITIAAGYLGVIAQATQIIVYNFTSLNYAVAIGL